MGRPSAADREAYNVESLSRVAFQLFRKRGYDATSVEQIARAAGITKSSIYHHVSSKEELLDRGVTRALDLLYATLDEPQSLSGTYVDRVQHILRRGVEVEVSHLDEVAVLLRLRGNTRIERRALERRRDFDRKVAVLITQAIENNEVRDDVDPLVVTRLLFSMANWLTEWFDPGGQFTTAEIGETIIRLAFEGLQGPTGLGTKAASAAAVSARRKE